MADKQNTKEKVANWIVASCLLAIFILAIVGLWLDRQVPVVVFGIIGGIAYGADGDIITTIFRSKK